MDIGSISKIKDAKFENVSNRNDLKRLIMRRIKIKTVQTLKK